MEKAALLALLLAGCSTADSQGVTGERYNITGKPGAFGLGEVDRGEMVTEARNRCPDGWEVLSQYERKNGIAGTPYVVWRIQCF